MKEQTKPRLSMLESAGRPPLESPYLDLDLRAIEAQAHQQRAEYLGSLLRRFFDWVERGALRARHRRIEQYLAGATDVVDLEQRMRALARREQGLPG